MTAFILSRPRPERQSYWRAGSRSDLSCPEFAGVGTAQLFLASSLKLRLRGRLNRDRGALQNFITFSK
ncbi:MAG: hypothetical protein AAFX40_16330 [Cyanobacteria bacterium J06639_1]